MIAINILIDINFDKPEYVAELYNNLANYQEKTDDKEGVVSSLIKVLNFLKLIFNGYNEFNFISPSSILKQVRNIYQELYGVNDKRVLKVKRQISIKLVLAENHQQALEELLETEVQQH